MRDIPADYGHWSNIHRRFCRWRDNGVWEKILGTLIDDPDFEWLIVDATHCKVHPHAAGAAWGGGATACPPESTGSGDGWAVEAGGDKSANNPLKATLFMPLAITDYPANFT